MSLEFPPHMKKWNSCAPLELYSAPVVKAVPEVSFTFSGPPLTPTPEWSCTRSRH